MSKILAPLSRQRFFDNTGLPLAGGQVFTYLAGTTTPQVTYSNQGGTTNTNPVVLDPYGYADIWLDPTLTYKFVLEDASNNVLWTEDNISLGIPTALFSNQTASYAYMGPSYGASAAIPAFRQIVANDLLSTLQAKTSTYTILSTDDVVTGDATSAAFTFTLPAANSVPAGKSLMITKIDSSVNKVTLGRAGSDTINDLTSFILGQQWDMCLLSTDGVSKWSIKSTNVTVSAIYENQAGTTMTGSVAVLPFDTKIKDSHGLISGSGTSWVCTITIAGTYLIITRLNSVATTSINSGTVNYFLNGSSALTHTWAKETTVSTAVPITLADSIQLNVGDVLTVRSTAVTVNLGLDSTAGHNRFILTRTGNY